MEGKTTQQVAAELGTTKARIVMAVNRHSHLKPANLFGQNFIWTAEEIQALQSHLHTHKRGRPEGSPKGKKKDSI